jgi:hypothetical protein
MTTHVTNGERTHHLSASPAKAKILAIVALLILAGATPPHEKRPASNTATQVQPPPAPISEYAPYPHPDSHKCYQSKNHDSADLCAQWRAAVAAEEAAYSAWWGNIVGGGAALLTLISLGFIFYALRQTERSLKQTREANEIARLSNRPWVFIRTLSIDQIRFLTDQDDKVSLHATGNAVVVNAGKLLSRTAAFDAVPVDTGSGSCSFASFDQAVTGSSSFHRFAVPLLAGGEEAKIPIYLVDDFALSDSNGANFHIVTRLLYRFHDSEDVHETLQVWNVVKGFHGSHHSIIPIQSSDIGSDGIVKPVAVIPVMEPVIT